MSFPKMMTVYNTSRSNAVCLRARRADNFLLRLFGLLGQRGLGQEAGLLISPSSGVHTIGMRFSIDVIALSKDHRVVGVWESVGPWRVRGVSFRTASVLELPSGRARQCGVSVGDQLAVFPASFSQAA